MFTFLYDCENGFLFIFICFFFFCFISDICGCNTEGRNRVTFVNKQDQIKSKVWGNNGFQGIVNAPINNFCEGQRSVIEIWRITDSTDLVIDF